MNIVLAGDAKTFSAALDAAEKRIAQLQGKTKGFSKSASSDFASAGRSAQQFGHSTVTSVQAASGALRELNGDFTNNIRAVERFITTIPGVANALKVIYPGVGLLAVGGMVYEVSKKVSEFIKTLNGVPKALQLGFGEMHSSAQLSNDALAITNDRLQEQIAKLEHKPVNSLKTAIDEDREASDKLSDSLTKALQKSQELVEKNKVGFWGSLMGKGDTSDASKFVTDTQAKIDAINSSYDETVSHAVDDGATEQNIREINEARAARLEPIYAAAHKTARQRLRDAQISTSLQDQFGMGKDQSGNEAIYAGFDTQMSDQEREIGGSLLQGSLKSTLRPLQDAATNTRDGNTQSQKRLKQMEAELNQEKLQYNITVKAEYDFWDARRNAFAAGSEAYNQIVAKQASLAEEMRRKASDAIKRYNEEQQRDAEVAQGIKAAIAKTDYEMSKGQYQAAVEGANAARQLAAVQEKINASLAEQVLQDSAGKTMTEYAAAAELAAIHTRAYGAELEKLIAQQKQISTDPYLTEADRAKQLGGLAQQQATLEGNRQLQIMQDAQRNDRSGTSGIVGATDALNELAASSRDAAGEMRKLVDSTLSSINETILRQMTGKGQRGDWTRLGQSVFSGIAETGLKKGEGMLLQGFGFGGKVDGSSAAQALWVRMAAGQQAGVAASGLLGGLMKGGASGSSGDGSASGFGAMLSNIVPFLANGSDNFPGGMAVVGDAGPELVNLPRGSQVIPNSTAFGGETHHHTWNIDARGATDPAQVNRQIMMAAPHIAAAAVKAVHERQARRPSSMR